MRLISSISLRSVETAGTVKELGKIGFEMAARFFGDFVGDGEKVTEDLLWSAEAVVGFKF